MEQPLERPLEQPAFGSANLTNCERELIHLAASVQPHGLLLVVGEPSLQIDQASANAADLLGIPLDTLLGQSLTVLGGDLVDRIRAVLASGDPLVAPVPMGCNVTVRGVPMHATVHLHRVAKVGLAIEMEQFQEGPVRRQSPGLANRLTNAVQAIGAAHAIPALAETVVRELRDLTGYDRVMVYRFDADGHGEIIAEAREPHLEAFLGRHYPATDIPQRARDLYLRNRVRLLVDVHYQPVPLVPRFAPATGEDLDMSMCTLRSMSPVHLQYLKNMGVTATLVASLVHDGKLWGLISCHHYSPKIVSGEYRAACDLLSDVISTRISALENFAEAQAEVLVRRLEHRVIEATAQGGDWRLALFDNPRHLLQLLDATGAALMYEGELMTAGDVPSTVELRALFAWLQGRNDGSLFQSNAISRLNPGLASLSPLASGVLAIELAPGTGEYFAWFRKEQLHDVVWGGDPHKVVMGNDPRELSPRRSFAEWHQIVRDTASPWEPRELALARAVGASLTDLILQIRAVRVLIAENQLQRVRTAVERSTEPVIIADANGRLLIANDALGGMIRRPHRAWESLVDLAPHFTEPQRFLQMVHGVRNERRPWRGELALVAGDGVSVPVAVRADQVPGPHGTALGFIVMLTDLTARKATEAARLRLQHAILRAQQPALPGARDLPPDLQGLMAAIWANAGVAVSEIADAVTVASVAPLLREVEDSTRHAAHLTSILSSYIGPDGAP